MAVAGMHVGDVGTAIELDVVDQNGVIVNLATSTLLQISFLRSDGTTFTKTAVFTTNGTDGKMQYVTQTGDLNLSGNWQCQGIVTFPGGLWHTDIQKFKVSSNVAG